ncbi:hypothetical protein [Janthinobacterium lividum]|uniref:hypothetical protein n=1 Tax=Janthinobacterium lividum TaxID=29581 RepID=UPI001B8276F0|nr:hypothetical protein [Janthinobacterium lividum]MBR7632272.1 hypothetical protein [Janthinobacterium lividum]
MDKQYLEEVEACGLFGEGVCEICGMQGAHPACEKRAIEADRKVQQRESEFLERYSLHGRRGSVGHYSKDSLDQAVRALQRHLGRPVECDLSYSIEGDSWWFIPEGWIGIIGFIVEKQCLTIFPLGSGLVGRSKLSFTPSAWCGITAYLAGQVEPVGRSTL